jgi:hypothetical protein
VILAISVNKEARNKYLDGLLLKNGLWVLIIKRVKISVSRLSINHAVLNSSGDA